MKIEELLLKEIAKNKLYVEDSFIETIRIKNKIKHYINHNDKVSRKVLLMMFNDYFYYNSKVIKMMLSDTKYEFNFDEQDDRYTLYDTFFEKI